MAHACIGRAKGGIDGGESKKLTLSCFHKRYLPIFEQPLWKGIYIEKEQNFSNINSKCEVSPMKEKTDVLKVKKRSLDTLLVQAHCTVITKTVHSYWH